MDYLKVTHLYIASLGGEDIAQNGDRQELLLESVHGGCGSRLVVATNRGDGPQSGPGV